MDLRAEIKGHVLEYYDDTHLYLVDGLSVPSVTEIVKFKFADKYKGIPQEILRKAAEKGTAVHKAIEEYCKNGTESDLPELAGYKYLQDKYRFQVLENEIPVILFVQDEPIAAGRLDMVIKNEAGQIGGVDIKRTSKLDIDYLTLQLNIYRIAYRQSYGVEWEFVRAFHLREDKRKFVEIPIAEDLAWELIKEYRNAYIECEI